LKHKMMCCSFVSYQSFIAYKYDYLRAIKKIMKSPILTILFALFSFSCCKPNKPNPTNPSGNFLTCKVNGTDWKADNSSGLGDYPLTAKLLFSDTVMAINALNINEEAIYIGLVNKSQKVKVQNYQLSKVLPYSSNANFDNNLATNQFETDSVNTGIATITNLDKTNNLIEGTFSFKAYNKVLLSTVVVTDGKFSINFTNQ
jgi:hypothetical protein